MYVPRAHSNAIWRKWGSSEWEMVHHRMCVDARARARLCVCPKRMHLDGRTVQITNKYNIHCLFTLRFFGITIIWCEITERRKYVYHWMMLMPISYACVSVSVSVCVCARSWRLGSPAWLRQFLYGEKIMAFFFFFRKILILLSYFMG